MMILETWTVAVQTLPSQLWNEEGVRLLDPDALGEATFSPTERCGVVLGRPEKGFGLFVELPNVSPYPLHNFEIAGSSFEMLRSYSITFSGIWHTHPPAPSAGVRNRRRDLDEDGTGPRPSAVDLDYHPLHLRMFIGYLGDLREFDLDGKEIGLWPTKWSRLGG